MPREVFGPDHAFLPRPALLSFEEIARLAALFKSLGVCKIRLTGGEPLLRKNLERLVEMLARLGGLEITLTTNGTLLAKMAKTLRAAGLDRVTVSLDALDDQTFRKINDAGVPVAVVLEGIEAAAAAGLSPVKVNMVVKRGVNDASILEMAKHFRGSGHILRFIEYMDVGSSNGWRMDEVVPSAEVIERIRKVYALEPIDANYVGEVAERWRYADGGGEIGVISSVSHAFCGTCTRLRLSTEGQVYTCLFAAQGTDLRQMLRSGASDQAILEVLRRLWSRRDDRYSEVRSEATTGLHKIEMSYIGG